MKNPVGRGAVASMALVLLLAACGGPSGAGETRQVLVDYVHDEVASSFLMYFPRDVTVHPGDTVQFRQEWTGEPHSVTMGTRVDEMMATVSGLMAQYADVPDEEIPDEAWAEFEAATEGLPWMLSEEDIGGDDVVNQNAAQPCFLDEGLPPEDPRTPCADADRVQPPFNGRQSYYNSGFIPYEGPQGNEFTVELTDDIEPGVYNFYCNLHGPGQAGTITVVDETEEIPSAADVARQAREEIDAVASQLIDAHNRAVEDGEDTQGEPLPLPVAGVFGEDPELHALVNEFVPEVIRTKVGEPVEWSFFGPHTVSFNVPSYFSQITVEDDDTVIFNPDALRPVNSPGFPWDEMGPPEGGGEAGGEPPGDAPESPEGSEDGPPDGGGPPEPIVVDAGEWDGEEFISSGMFFDGSYRLTFTEPGTYSYACLIHPKMVATVFVEE